VSAACSKLAAQRTVQRTVQRTMGNRPLY
jgi:hypothetical protein